jgi:hypothetical protein
MATSAQRMLSKGRRSGQSVETLSEPCDGRRAIEILLVSGSQNCSDRALNETGRLYDRQKFKLMCDKWLHKLKLKQVLASKQVLKITVLPTTLQITK